MVVGLGISALQEIENGKQILEPQLLFQYPSQM
jgi:hypothetical protein